MHWEGGWGLYYYHNRSRNARGGRARVGEVGGAGTIHKKIIIIDVT